MATSKEFSATDFMREALVEARKAFDQKEVPVGAVLVYQNQIIARGFNQVESKHDATAHAEMICLRNGAKYLNAWRLTDATLYTTLEPCYMCAGALALSRVRKVVWGAPDIRHGVGETIISPIHQVEMVGNILERESADLLRTFFQMRREENATGCC